MESLRVEEIPSRGTCMCYLQLPPVDPAGRDVSDEEPHLLWMIPDRSIDEMQQITQRLEGLRGSQSRLGRTCGEDPRTVTSASIDDSIKSLIVIQEESIVVTNAVAGIGKRS